jgi:acetolactate synthase I/II/III large subunit
MSNGSNASSSRTGGRLVVDSLRAHGVDTAFCVPGESYLEVLDAFHDAANDIKLVTCRHENGAANMAEAYGKLTGKAGVCLVTRGPGACNASIGVHTAFQDSTPMVLLVGQVPSTQIGREALQEVDFRWMFGPVAKWVDQVRHVDEIPAVMARAFRAAVSGRPGPAVVALPEDLLREASEAPEVGPYRVVQVFPDMPRMARLRALLDKAERPVMMVGGSGWTLRGRGNIQAFADANNLPTCCSFRRHDIFDNTHRCFIGEFGLDASPALAERVRNSDLLLVVGARLGQVTTMGYKLLDEPQPRQTLIHVHADIDEPGRVFQPSLAVHAGMTEFAEAAERLEPVDGGRWKDWATDARREYEENITPAADGAVLDMGAIMMALRERLAPDAIVVTDAAITSVWPQRFLLYGAGRRLLAPTSGAMGYGVPGAVMAKIVAPERQVVALVGDGCFGMTGQELATAAACGAAPVIIVLNNGIYGTIRLHQERRHPGRVVATNLTNPDFAALAEAYGGFGAVVERTDDFVPAFENALASGKAAVIDVRIDPEIITPRTTITALRQAATKPAGGGFPIRRRKSKD